MKYYTSQPFTCASLCLRFPSSFNSHTLRFFHQHSQTICRCSPRPIQRRAASANHRRHDLHVDQSTTSRARHVTPTMAKRPPTPSTPVLSSAPWAHLPTLPPTLPLDPIPASLPLLVSLVLVNTATMAQTARVTGSHGRTLIGSMPLKKKAFLTTIGPHTVSLGAATFRHLS